VVINNSYMIKYISEKFPELCIVDTFASMDFSDLFVYGDTKKQKIVIYDEENFEINNKKNFKLPKKLHEDDNIYIIKTPVGLKKYNYKNVVLSVYFDILEDLFSLSLIEEKELNDLISNNENKYTFLSLNNTVNINKFKLIKELSKNNLLEKAYVSFGEYKKNNFRLTTEEKKFLKISDYTNRYKIFEKPPERVCHTFRNVECSANFINNFYIKKNMSTNIALMQETFLHRYYPCEKTFLPFFTQKIPIILSAENSMLELKKQGFDIFEDMVDFSYDSEKEKEKRVKKCVNNNLDLLRTGIQTNKKIKERFDFNFFHLKIFFQNQLELLENDIKSCLRK